MTCTLSISCRDTNDSEICSRKHCMDGKVITTSVYELPRMTLPDSVLCWLANLPITTLAILIRELMPTQQKELTTKSNTNDAA